MDVPFSEEDIQYAILNAPKENVPGPDRFIGLFFSSCWSIVKDDIVGAIQQFYHMNQLGLLFLNQDFVVLVPKKSNPTTITDYMPISLSHSFAKIVSKLLANRLGPELDQLISINQTAFYQEEMHT
jgi:hypothetical protein